MEWAFSSFCWSGSKNAEWVEAIETKQKRTDVGKSEWERKSKNGFNAKTLKVKLFSCGNWTFFWMVEIGQKWGHKEWADIFGWWGLVKIEDIKNGTNIVGW